MNFKAKWTLTKVIQANKMNIVKNNKISQQCGVKVFEPELCE